MSIYILAWEWSLTLSKIEWSTSLFVNYLWILYNLSIYYNIWLQRKRLTYKMNWQRWHKAKGYMSNHALPLRWFSCKVTKWHYFYCPTTVFRLKFIWSGSNNFSWIKRILRHIFVTCRRNNWRDISLKGLKLCKTFILSRYFY